MATNIDELVVRIKADTKQLNKALDKVKKKTKETGDSGKKGFSGMAASLGKVKGKALVAAAAIAGIAALVRPIAKVGMAFEDLQISLNTVFGGIRGGKDAFNQVIDFAKTTPFQIEDVTKAFIRLKSAGLEPDIEMLKTFGDAASIAGNATEAFASLVKIASKATGGGLGLEELEQLETQGIAVYPILRKQLNLTRDKIADFGKTTEGAALIITALQKGLSETTGGTMAARMENLSTKTSNLEIAFKQLGLSIFEGGLGDTLKGLTDDITGMVDAITAVVEASNLAKDIKANVSSTFARAITDDTAKTEGSSQFTRRRAEERLDSVGGLEGAAQKEAERIAKLLEMVQSRVAPLRKDFANNVSFGNAKDLFDLDPNEAIKELETSLLFVENFMKDRKIKLDLELAPKDDDGKPIISKEEQAKITRKGEVINAIAPLEKIKEKALQAGDPLLAVKEMFAHIAMASEAVDKDGNRLFDDKAIKLLEDYAKAQKKIIEDKGLADAGNKIRQEFSGAISAIQGTVSETKELEDQIAQIDSALDDKDKLAQMFPEMTVQQVKDGLAILRAELVQIGVDAKNASIEEDFGDVKSAIENTITPATKLAGVIEKITLLAKTNPDALEDMLGGMKLSEVLKILNADLEDLKNKTEDVSETLGGQLQQAVTNSANAFTNNFVNALMDGKDALGSFKDFAKSMVSQIIAIFVQMAIVNEILNAVFNLTGKNAFPTLGGGSGTGGGGGTSGRTMSGMMASAGGGTYQKGVPTLVGERGPELIIPNTGGRVMNGMNTKNAMGGGSTIVVNQSLNFSTGVVGTVRAEINKMMPTIAEVSKSAVLDASRRGGNYRKGLLGA